MRVFWCLETYLPSRLPPEERSSSVAIMSLFSYFIFVLPPLLVAQTVKPLLTMWETRVWPLGWEEPLEKEMATHSSIIAWEIPWMGEPGNLQSMGSQRVGND